MFDRKCARMMRDSSQNLVLVGAKEGLITDTQAKALYVAIDGMTKLYITNIITKDQFVDTIATLVKEVHAGLEARLLKLRIPTNVVVNAAPTTMQ